MFEYKKFAEHYNKANDIVLHAAAGLSFPRNCLPFTVFLWGMLLGDFEAKIKAYIILHIFKNEI